MAPIHSKKHFNKTDAAVCQLKGRHSNQRFGTIQPAVRWFSFQGDWRYSDPVKFVNLGTFLPSIDGRNMTASSTSIGTPLSDISTRVLLCGSGELGKEIAIELQRLGIEVIAVDRYANAPAMQVEVDPGSETVA